PMRRAANRSARSGSVHQRHRLKGQGSQGLQPTKTPSFMLGFIVLAKAFKAFDDGIKHFQGQMLGRPFRTQLPAGYRLPFGTLPTPRRRRFLRWWYAINPNPKNHLLGRG